MAYSNYGAFVHHDGKRVTENEDCEYKGRLVHGLISDGSIDVVCYKTGLPLIYKDGIRIDYYDEDKIDCYNFDSFNYDLDGYHFEFVNYDKPYEVLMKTPKGDVWVCKYDYQYGAGFERHSQKNKTKRRKNKLPIFKSNMWKKYKEQKK